MRKLHLAHALGVIAPKLPPPESVALWGASSLNYCQLGAFGVPA